MPAAVVPGCVSRGLGTVVVTEALCRLAWAKVPSCGPPVEDAEQGGYRADDADRRSQGTGSRKPDSRARQGSASARAARRRARGDTAPALRAARRASDHDLPPAL